MNKSKGEDKLNRRGRPIRFEGDIESRAFAPRQNPLPAPPLEIDAAPFVCLVVNMSWVSHVLGVIETLNQNDAWTGDDVEKDRARQEIQKLLVQLMTGDACVIDPCCPEDTDLLQQIVNLNTTIVNNQTTIINNQEISIDQNTTIIDNSQTIIDNSETTIIQNFLNNYNQWVYENHEVSILNQMLYDGTPQSIHPAVPEAGWSASAATRDALCLACTRYLEQVLQIVMAGGVLVSLAAGGVTALAAIALGIALAPVTGGASIVAGIVAGIGIAAGSGAALSTILNNSAAQRKVVCCMFDTLKDQPITFETFKLIGTDCVDPEDENVALIAEWVTHASQVESSYLNFLRLVGEAQGHGNELDCDCCNDIADYEIEAINDCIITRENDFQWRIVQTNYTTDMDDPFCTEGKKIYTVEFKESFGRCIDIIAGGLPSGWEQIDCAGNPQEGPGGGGGQGIYFKWYKMTCPPDSSTVDIIITVACPVLGIVPA